MSKLKQKVEEFLLIQQETIQHRKEWANSTKSKLLDKLRQINEAHKLKWHVDINDVYENSETIYITQGKIPSGIAEIHEKRFKQFLKTSGALLYSQSHNGRIVVWIQFPSIDERIPEMPPKHIDTFNPKNFSEDMVEEHFEKFLSEMIQWEKSGERSPIGFK